MGDPNQSEEAGTRPICRCEEIVLEAVEQAIAEGARTLDDVKRRTRAGMGTCQGVYCAPELADLLAARTGVGAAAIVPMTARPPVRPLPLGLLTTEER